MPQADKQRTPGVLAELLYPHAQVIDSPNTAMLSGSSALSRMPPTSDLINSVIVSNKFLGPSQLPVGGVTIDNSEVHYGISQHITYGGISIPLIKGGITESLTLNGLLPLIMPQVHAKMRGVGGVWVSESDDSLELMMNCDTWEYRALERDHVWWVVCDATAVQAAVPPGFQHPEPRFRKEFVPRLGHRVPGSGYKATHGKSKGSKLDYTFEPYMEDIESFVDLAKHNEMQGSGKSLQHLFYQMVRYFWFCCKMNVFGPFGAIRSYQWTWDCKTRNLTKEKVWNPKFKKVHNVADDFPDFREAIDEDYFAAFGESPNKGWCGM